MKFQIQSSTQTSMLLILAVSVLFLFSPSSVAQEKKQNQNRLPVMFRNVKLAADQKAKIRSFQEEANKKLASLNRKQNEVLTPEQLEKRRATLREARKNGMSQREARKLVDEKTKLSQEQTEQLAGLNAQRNKIQKELQAAYLNVLSPEQKRQIDASKRSDRGARAKRIAPTYADISYGPHERNIMDVWLAKADKPTPVFFSIHGGGFRAGNKGIDSGLLQACLDQGISVVAITYRLSGEAIAPAQFHDSARAIQFVRSKSSQWNLDKSRFASSGGSAGAGISMWLAFHDDLADAENKDPVLRESTRLKCAIVYNGQTTYDPREIKKLIPEANTFRESALEQLFGIDSSKNLENLPADKSKLIEECSPINHVTKDDVPVLLAYASKAGAPVTSQGVGIHHPRFGTHLKKKMDPLGIECRVETSSRRGSEQWVKQTMAFLKKHL